VPELWSLAGPKPPDITLVIVVRVASRLSDGVPGGQWAEDKERECRETIRYQMAYIEDR
jgi:hypothetical protein